MMISVDVTLTAKGSDIDLLCVLIRLASFVSLALEARPHQGCIEIEVRATQK